MDFNSVLSEVSILRDHLYKDPDEYVRKWSLRQCRDYQVPLIRLISFLSDGTRDLRVRDSPESMAVLDIVEKSELRHLLEFDSSSQTIRFKSEVAFAEKKSISDLLNSRAFILVEYGATPS